MVQDLLPVAAEAGVKWAGRSLQARVAIVFVRSVAIKSCTLSANHVMKKRARSVARK